MKNKLVRTMASLLLVFALVLLGSKVDVFAESVEEVYQQLEGKTVDEQRALVKSKIKSVYDKGKLTEEEYNEFLIEIDRFDEAEEFIEILGEAYYFDDQDENPEESKDPENS